jgi:hypothetical protein
MTSDGTGSTDQGGSTRHGVAPGRPAAPWPPETPGRSAAADGPRGRRAAGQLDPDGWADAGQGRRWKQPNISSLSRGRGKLAPTRSGSTEFLQVSGLSAAPSV